MFTLSILRKNWISQSYLFWLNSFLALSTLQLSEQLTPHPDAWLSHRILYRILPSVFCTCALCPRQRLLVMPCQNAAVVFRARVQLHITRQLGNQNKESEIIDLYPLCRRWHFHIVENHLLNSQESWCSFYHRMLKTPHWYLFFTVRLFFILPVVSFGLFEMFSIHRSPWKQVKSHQKPLQSFGLSC